MMKRRDVVAPILGAVALLISVIAWRQSRQPRPSPVAVEETSSSTATWGPELRALRAEVGLLRASRTAPETSAPAPAGAPQAPAKTPEQYAEEARLVNNKTADGLDERMQGERVDAAWSQEAVTQIRAAFRQHLPKANVTDVRCASTICRVVVQHEAGDRIMSAPMDLLSAPPFNQETFFRREPTSTTVFIIRQAAAQAENAAL